MCALGARRCCISPQIPFHVQPHFAALAFLSRFSFAIWRKRDGARKSELSELPKRHESYESYKGDVTLNKSPHHGIPYIYTRPGGMRALMSPSLCFRLCLTLSLSEPQLHVKQCQCPHHRPEGTGRPEFAFLSPYFPQTVLLLLFPNAMVVYERQREREKKQVSHSA